MCSWGRIDVAWMSAQRFVRPCTVVATAADSECGLMQISDPRAKVTANCEGRAPSKVASPGNTHKAATPGPAMATVAARRTSAHARRHSMFTRRSRHRVDSRPAAMIGYRCADIRGR